MHLIGISSLVGRRERGRSEVTGARSGHSYLDRERTDVQRAGVAAVPFVADSLGEIVAAFGLPCGREHHSQEFANTKVLQAGLKETVDFLVQRFGRGVL
jgi:hypothetical protein